MIKYNNNTIYDWNFDTSNLIKVYRNNAIVFYKFSGESPTPEWKVCFAVVDDISQYTDREFEDVYDNATEKWYKLNNLNEYEEYGVYGSGRSITYYKGKLTIDEGYEYEWNGSEWINLGEIEEGESRLPQGYTEVEYVQHSNDVRSTGNVFWTVPNDGVSGNVYTVDLSLDSNQSGVSRYIQLFGSTYGYCYRQNRGYNYNANVGYMTKINYSNSYAPPYDTKLRYRLEPLELTVTNTVVSTSTTINLSASRSMSSGGADFGVFNANMNDGGAYILKGKIYSILIEDSNGVIKHNYVPCKRDSDDTVGLYDIIGNGFYNPSVLIVTAGEEVVKKIYPKYYSEKSEPLNDLTFDTMAEAQAYAYNNCVYDGMKAIIDGDRYYFDSSDENGWVKILEYYKVEDVTPSGASGWTISGSSTYNPDSSYYDDFDLETTSSFFETKIAKVTIYGYDHFTYYLRSSNGYSSSYAYVVATNVDEVSTPPSTLSYNSSSAITNIYNWGKSPKSAVNLSNYRRVTYNNLDKTVEHTFYVYFSGRTYSIYNGNATILIPKEQTNENWEQVTFSASSNVASSRKNLYIDGNNSTSGGTNYWYSRWIVGLPSGSHSSHTNYSSYDYCPNVTSSTFTSVAGEQRQVNFTYDGTTSKSLSFRLADGNGNVLTPSDTVYYDMRLYNSCNVQTNSSNLTFPRNQYVKVGGGFAFFNSSNRHYIYGYQAPKLATRYNTDDYQDTFDIVYTKLNTEAVTVTYVTYDPSDTEVPSFSTKITYQYNGDRTSATTLTSFDVPYTYPYTVNQTNDMFSADSQSYTASQAARTISFTLYPNNREFASVADMEAYGYAWEGMEAYVGNTNYKYNNGEWVEYSGTIWFDPSATNALFSIGHYWGENYKMVITTYLSGSYTGDYGSFWEGQNGHTPIELSFYSNGFYYDMHNPTSTTAPNVYSGDYSFRIVSTNVFSKYQNSQVMELTLTYGSFKAELADSGTLIYSSGSTKTGYSWYSGLYQANIGFKNANAKCHLSHIQIYNGNDELVNDFKFIKNNGVVGSQEISIYDSVTNTTYNNTNSNTPVYHIET